MKILSVAWTIYDDQLKEFMNNCTGGGLVIRNICEYIGKKEESYLMIGRQILPEIQMGNVHIIKTDYDKMQKNIKGNNQEYIEYMTRIFENAVEDIAPDIINFHGYGEFAFSCIDNVCRKHNLRYVVTEHLFINNEEVFSGYEQSARYAQYLYNIPDIQVIAVSNGMKKKIVKQYPVLSTDQIKVILNGTDFKPEYISNNLKDQYSITDKKILLCVGTLLERKNQMQIVDIFAKDVNLQKKIAVIFCGKDSLNGKLQFEIERQGLQKSLIYAGALSSEDMKKYYSIADGLIMPSYAEGLSIAALEAIAYGLPVIMFNDSECADDLNDPKVVCIASNRSNEALIEAVWNWFFSEWDRSYIENYSKRFTMERMADDYLEYYRKIIS